MMKAFELVDARSASEAVALLRRHGARAQAFASGADLLYLLKDGVEGPALSLPEVLVNLGEIEGLRQIRFDGSGLSLGPMVRLSEIVEHPLLRAEYSLLVQSAERVASSQLRNTSTVGGNLCQRPRCWYFRNPDVVCLKKGGSTCWAIDGDNRYYHAILEGGPCHIVHPSDLAPALIALDARVSILGPGGTRTSPLEDFFVTTERDLHRENVLGAQDILTEIVVPRPTRARQVFLKATVRQTGEFALCTVALSLRTERGVCRDSRVVLGGVSPRPLRSRSAEAVVAGKPLSAEVTRAAATAAFAEARPMSMNAYKVTLGEGLVRRAFELAMAETSSPAR